MQFSEFTGSSSISRSISRYSDRRQHRSRCDRETLKVAQAVNCPFKKAVYCRTYYLSDASSVYDRSVSKYIDQMAKRITVQIKPHAFNSDDPISIIGFFKKFKLHCDTNDVHERVAL